VALSYYREITLSFSSLHAVSSAARIALLQPCQPARSGAYRVGRARRLAAPPSRSGDASTMPRRSAHWRPARRPTDRTERLRHSSRVATVVVTASGNGWGGAFAIAVWIWNHEAEACDDIAIAPT
jgi:hypothetical protein